MDHIVTVEELDDEYDVTCTCSWQDTGYEEHEDAEAAGDEHIRDPEG